MKEHIYTIALTDALAEKCECPLCIIEKKLDSDTVDYYTGAAMMEPDVRCETNAKGFCPVHFRKMKENEKTLSVALVLQTRLKEIIPLLQPEEIKKKRLFAKEEKSCFDEKIKESFSGCAACERVAKKMVDCVSNFVYLLSEEKDFKDEYLASKGLCMKHFIQVAELAKGEVKNEIILHQKKEMERIAADIDRFVLKFDYRNADMPWENAKDAPERAIFKLRGEYDGKF